ncbi:MAG: DNA-directed RNA polymerase subunit omega [Terriglobia bacterium]
MDSKFRFILIAAKRARQLQAGAQPLAHCRSKKAAKVATTELEAGWVPIAMPPTIAGRKDEVRRSHPGVVDSGQKS